MILQADAARIPLADKSVHCVCTSPPYWGLRKYQGEQGRGLFANLGLEPTPEEHIEHIVEIFREVRRVLRDDGTVWLNYGDCYASSWASGRRSVVGNPSRTNRVDRTTGTPFKEGDLCIMPHRVAIALQANGWIIRNDVVWYKRNPMPESVAGWRWERKREKISKSNHATEHNIKGGHKKMLEDASVHQGISPDWLAEYEYGDDYVLRKSSWRHTRAHEYIFQLVKGMGYYANQEAVRVPHDDPKRGKGEHESKTPHMDEEGKRWVVAKRQYNPSGRNPRSVLDVPTAPYKGAHYATFPPRLIAPLIRASCPKRCCPECGAAWAPVIDKSVSFESGSGKAGNPPQGKFEGSEQALSGDYDIRMGPVIHSSISDYRPTCSCGHEPVPGIVLDPFLGSGTTGAIARELGRRWVGLDISFEYLDQQAKPRALKWTPSDALDELPLFKENV